MKNLSRKAKRKFLIIPEQENIKYTDRITTSVDENIRVSTDLPTKTKFYQLHYILQSCRNRRMAIYQKFIITISALVMYS